jgi:hypothetical protein
MSWELLKTHKELITNGLDLISFILITPSLLNLGEALYCQYMDCLCHGRVLRYLCILAIGY